MLAGDSNGRFDDQAEAAEQAGDYARAAELWAKAAAAALGHDRRKRYQAAADYCRERAQQAQS